MGCCETKKTEATRAGMCAVCPRMRLEHCTVDGVACVDHAKRGDCPKGRYPDAAGRVRWLGVGWSGMPAPLRWRFQGRYGRAPRVDGCGCIEAVKRYWVEQFADADGMPNGRWDVGKLIRALVTFPA